MVTQTNMPAAPAVLYLALHTSDPTKTCAVGEVVGSGYARTAITFAAQTTAQSEDVENAAAVIFPTATGTEPLPITHYSIWDAATAGNALFYGTLDASVAWNLGGAVAFSIAALKKQFVTVPVVSFTPA